MFPCTYGGIEERDLRCGVNNMSIQYRNGRLGVLAMLGVFIGLLTGCSANHKSIYRHQQVEADASITTTDAKQRVILSSGNSGSGAARFCAEPSPDVFAVIAQSLSVGGSLGQQADPKAIQAALNAAFSSAEQGSTIPRTQTINMLRELMYRTCERYLNGGINTLELPLQAIRDQRLMVSILAIEQLTGAVTSKSVALGAIAQANAGASTTGAMAMLDKARKEIKDTATALGTAQTAYKLKVKAKVDGADKEFEACAAIANAKTDADKQALPKEVKDKTGDCEKLKAAMDKAESEHKEAKTHHEQLSKLVGAGSIPVSTGTELMMPTALGGIDRAGGGTIGDVSGVVKSIVELNFRQDEFLLLCVKRLGEGQPANNDAINSKCLEYVTRKIDEEKSLSELAASKADLEKTKADLEKAEKDLQLRRRNTEIQRLRDQADQQFDAFWKMISNDDGLSISAARLQATQQKSAALQRCPRPITPTSTKTEARACFEALTASQKDALAPAAPRP